KSWFADAIEAVREVVQGGSPTQEEQPVSTAHAEANVSEGASERVPEPVVSTALVAPVREEAHEQLHQETISAETAKIPSHFSEHPSFETKSDAEIITTPVDSAPSHKDPALDMPPAAHVTPEPLLVRDEQSADSSYEDHHEHSAPLQSFPFPGEPEPTNGEPAADPVVASHEEAPAPIFAAASEESAADESEHID